MRNNNMCIGFRDVVDSLFKTNKFFASFCVDKLLNLIQRFYRDQYTTSNWYFISK